MLEFAAMMRVTVNHTEGAPPVGTPEHTVWHRTGSADTAMLIIKNAGYLHLPLTRGSLTHHVFISVTQSDEGELVITERKPYPQAPFYHDGHSSTQWFDALVGVELTLIRHRVAIDACTASQRNPEDCTRAHPVKIPACTIDRICDQLRDHQLSLGSERHCL